MPDDEIRLTVPADPDLVGVVVAAVAAVVRRTGMGDESIARARDDAAAAFDEVLAGGTGDELTLTAGAERHRYRFELRRGDRSHTSQRQSPD